MVDDIYVSDEHSSYIIGAYCGDNQVGSAQWTGEGTTVVVMGNDGVTPGTETYCFGGVPQLGIPADIPTYKCSAAL